MIEVSNDFKDTKKPDMLKSQFDFKKISSCVFLRETHWIWNLEMFVFVRFNIMSDVLDFGEADILLDFLA